MDVIVEFRHVPGERGAVRWAKPVSFQVPRGTLHLIRTRGAFSGPLFRLALGFSEPVGGEVLVQGQLPATLGRHDIRRLRRGIGSVLEPDGLVANLTIRMNLVVPLVYGNGLEFDAAVRRANEMIDVMHLGLWAEERPGSLPAEVRQAAVLARALSARTDVLMLENPLASMDNRETRRLLTLCRTQAETLLVATHRPDGVLHEFADAIWEWDDDGFRMAA